MTVELHVTRGLQLWISSCYFKLLYGPVSYGEVGQNKKITQERNFQFRLVLQTVRKKRFRYTKEDVSRSHWPCGLRHRSSAIRLLRLWVRIPPGTWMFLCCDCRVLSDRGLCDELITRPEESYRLRWAVVCDLVTT